METVGKEQWGRYISVLDVSCLTGGLKMVHTHRYRTIMSADLSTWSLSLTV